MERLWPVDTPISHAVGSCEYSLERVLIYASETVKKTREELRQEEEKGRVVDQDHAVAEQRQAKEMARARFASAAAAMKAA